MRRGVDCFRAGRIQQITDRQRERGRPYDNSPFPTVQGRLSSAMMMDESLFAMPGMSINGKNPGIRTALLF